jgi:hypothetical protein
MRTVANVSTLKEMLLIALLQVDASRPIIFATLLTKLYVVTSHNVFLP